MTQQDILAQNSTKTEKIKLLLSLGMTRKQVATLMGVGYGFVQNVYAKMQPATTTPLVLGLMPFERKFGVEIEAFSKGKTIKQLVIAIKNKGITCQNQNYNHTTAPSWKIVSDSSINADGVTFEIVSPILQGEDGLIQTQKVCEVLKAFGARINKSCGLHIHFDAQNFNLQTWKNLLINYANIENVIDKFMPESRRADNNRYCKSFKNDIEFIKKADNFDDIVDKMGIRYKKINTESYARHKTVEFRQHSGTIEFEKIKNWVLFLHNLTVASERGIINGNSIEDLISINQPDIIAFYAERTEELN